ncbi:hypothetical protein NP233_g2817 [Leucocoprinus birnbaumii]|uniref:Uncharacterized protein n=1 Tax=Leucocoprinus birnbaumii TaxID=56174 RepID=A0AAD5W004_9AGAR|nr:hypothetical protein NP233_g2817 [Leucocoprinus birnbaumii]
MLPTEYQSASIRDLTRMTTGLIILAIMNGGLWIFGITCLVFLSRRNPCRDQEDKASIRGSTWWKWYIVILLGVNVFFLVTYSTLFMNTLKGIVFSWPVNPLLNGAGMLTISLTDGVLVWRCFMVTRALGSQRKIEAVFWIFPLCNYIVTAVTALIGTIHFFVPNFAASPKTQLLWPVITLFSNAILNVYAATYICIRLFNYQRLSRKVRTAVLGPSSRTSEQPESWCNSIMQIFMQSAAINVPLAFTAAIANARFDWRLCIVLSGRSLYLENKPAPLASTWTNPDRSDSENAGRAQDRVEVLRDGCSSADSKFLYFIKLSTLIENMPGMMRMLNSGDDVDQEQHSRASIGLVLQALLTGGSLTLGIMCLLLLSGTSRKDGGRNIHSNFWKCFIPLLLGANVFFLVTFCFTFMDGLLGKGDPWVLNALLYTGGLYTICLTDGVLVWRCYMVTSALGSHRKRDIAFWVLPLCMYIVTVVTTLIGTLNVFVTKGRDRDDLTLPHLWAALSLCFNAVLNVYSSLYITLRLLDYQQLLNRARRVATGMPTIPKSAVHMCKTVTQILLQSAIINTPLAAAAAVASMKYDWTLSMLMACVGVPCQVSEHWDKTFELTEDKLKNFAVPRYLAYPTSGSFRQGD